MADGLCRRSCSCRLIMVITLEPGWLLEALVPAWCVGVVEVQEDWMVLGIRPSCHGHDDGGRRHHELVGRRQWKPSIVTVIRAVASSVIDAAVEARRCC